MLAEDAPQTTGALRRRRGGRRRQNAQNAKGSITPHHGRAGVDDAAKKY
jgi:hypothetical protein